MNSASAKKTILLLGDIAVLYAALFLTLLLRYGRDFYEQFANFHALPFTIVFAVWIAVLYASELYDLRHLRNNLDFLKSLILALAVSSALAVFFFYLVPYFGITPKTNLFTFIAIFALIETFWRRLFNSVISSSEAPNKVLLIGEEEDFAPINQIASSFPEWLSRLGYKITKRIGENEISGNLKKINDCIKSSGANLIVIPRHLKNNTTLMREFYKLLNSGIEIYDLPRFYEIVARKIPLAALEETWFLENLVGRQKFYDPIKRAAELFSAATLAAALAPLELIIALAIKLTSSGPIIYKQARMGERGKEFILYKFRTMKTHENHSWPEENDGRITKIGKILRKTHLDELPQLVNIIKGDISVVGPRPDFVDFYKNLEKEIPYYSIRTLIKPGLTGWAQIHKPIIASLEDTRERLEYDLYYIKNRSLVLDLAIILKTFKVLLMARGL